MSLATYTSKTWTDYADSPCLEAVELNRIDSGIAAVTAELLALEAALPTTYQPISAELSTLAALSSTGYAKRSGAAAWSVVSSIPQADVSGLTTALAGKEPTLGSPSTSGYLLSSTTAGVRSWVAPYTHPATHPQSVVDSASGWITTALAGKQAGSSVLTSIAAQSSGMGFLRLTAGVASLDATAYQPLDSDLTAIAALATTAFGRSLLTVADAAAARTAIGAQASGSYLQLSGGLMTGGITFANGIWNAVGDDAQFGDMNVGNTIGIRGIQNTGVGYFRFGTTSVATSGTLANDFGWNGASFVLGGNSIWHSGNFTPGNYQPLDSDLTAVAALATTGFVRRTAADTWAASALVWGDIASGHPSVTAGTGLTGGGSLTGSVTLAVSYGTAAGTAAQGNDSRILNGQTAFGWGNHASAGYALAGTSATFGNAELGSSLTGSGGWFGYAGSNQASRYTGFYAPSDLSVRIASASGKNVSIGTGSAYGALVVADGSVTLGVALAGTSASFSSSVSAGTHVFGGGWDGTTYTTPCFVGSWNSSFTWGIVGGNGASNDNTIGFRTLSASRVAVGYANIAAAEVRGTNGIFSGSITRGGNAIWDAGNLVGTRNEHNHAGVYMPLAGGTMGGDINLGGYSITSGSTGLGNGMVSSIGGNFTNLQVVSLLAATGGTRINLGTNLIPTTDSGVQLGQPDKRFIATFSLYSYLSYLDASVEVAGPVMRWKDCIVIGNGGVLPIVGDGCAIVAVGQGTGGVTNKPTTNNYQSVDYRKADGTLATAAAGGNVIDLDLYGRCAFIVGVSSSRAQLIL